MTSELDMEPIRNVDPNDVYILPGWAEEEIRKIKEKMSGLFDLSKEDFKYELEKMKKREQVKTIIEMGTEKVLFWLKTRDAVLRLIEGDKVREKLKSEGKWKELIKHPLSIPPPKISIEEKEQLMELILRQSELLMLYDIYYKAGCISHVPNRKLKLRQRLPIIADERTEGSYSLPYWAFSELKQIMTEKKIKTSNEEAVYLMTPILNLPKSLRKMEIERRLEKGTIKLLKYLKAMNKARQVDLIIPTQDDKLEKYHPKTLKEVFLHKKRAEYQKKIDVESKGVDIEEDYTGEASFQRLREVMNLEEKILKMDQKMRAYDAYLKSVEEIITRANIKPIPKFEVPSDKLNMSYKFDALMNKSEIPKFNKKEYLDTLKRIFLTNLMNGLQDDNGAMKEQQNLQHIDYLLKVLDEIEYYTEAFNIYLFENQEDLMINTRAFLDVGSIVVVKEAEIIEAQKILSILKSALYSLGGLLKFRRVCHSMLYDLAPYEWKMEYNKEKEQLQWLANKEADRVLGHLAFFKMNVPVQQPVLDRLIIFLSDTIRNLGPPANYFSNGFELDLAIRQLELENLNALQSLMSVVKSREELETQKEEFIRNSENEIKEIEFIIEKMKEELQSKVERIKKLDRRSEQVANVYWRVVRNNDALVEAVVLTKSLFDQFVGQDKQPTDDPIEMLTALSEDITTTHVLVSEVPRIERDRILKSLNAEDKDAIREAFKAKELNTTTENLLKSMKRSLFGINIGLQGHPARFRAKTLPLQSKDKLIKQSSVKNKKSSTSVSRRVMKRVLNLFEPTKQDDALLDTLSAFEKIRQEARDRRFYPGLRRIDDSSESDISQQELILDSLSDDESSDESLKGENMQEFDWRFAKQLKAAELSESTSTVSQIIPSITEESVEKDNEVSSDENLNK